MDQVYLMAPCRCGTKSNPNSNPVTSTLDLMVYGAQEYQPCSLKMYNSFVM